ncbi:MAG: citrate/2-methylcitrate synthase [bacterium]
MLLAPIRSANKLAGGIALAQKGLKGVILTESKMSYLNGDEGILSYRGYDIDELVGKVQFEELFHLFWDEEFPNAEQLEKTKKNLAQNMPVEREVLDFCCRLAEADMHPMAALRTLVSALAAYDPDAEAQPDALLPNLRKANRIAAKTITLIAAYDRSRRDLEIIAPDPHLSHAANFLYMLKGEKPTEREEDVFNTCLVLHADHGFNASTFAARVTASTFADMHSAVTSAIGTLKGLLHGGANSEVMKELLEIDKQGIDPVDYVKQKLKAKEKVMGFGHRVYNTIDPRSPYLRKMSEQLGREQNQLRWYKYSRAIEKFMEAEKGIRCNVDFYSASVYYLLGIPVDLYTAIFAASRIVGWIGHILEQYDENTLIRPRARYTGPMNKKLVPLEQRK